MKRIGIAASTISKGNKFLYNFYVVLISFLFSLFLFVIAGASVLFALMIIAYVSQEVAGTDLQRDWRPIMTLCMITLSCVIGIFNVVAILVNIRFPRLNRKQSK